MKNSRSCCSSLVVCILFAATAPSSLASWLGSASTKSNNDHHDYSNDKDNHNEESTVPPPPSWAWKDLHKYINFTHTRQSALDHYALPHVDSEQVVDDIAVFLLGTLSNTVQFGEKQSEKHGADYFFERVVAARMTWARYVKHFFVVTGAGDAEKRVLANPSYCTNLTGHHVGAGGLNNNFHNQIHSFQMFQCAGIHILHFVRCEGTSWGSKGPCCRCEGAMRHFLDAYRWHSHGGQGSYPKWFVFADDDYWMRMHAMSSVFKHMNIDPDKEYALVPGPNFNIVSNGAGATSRINMGGKRIKNDGE